MNALSDFARRWLDWSIAASWQLAVLVCLIAALTLLLRNASPRLRYGLWTLVLLKALLPPTLTAFWGVGAWGVAPVTELADVSLPVELTNSNAAASGERATFETSAAAQSTEAATGTSGVPSLATTLLVAWAAGCLALWLAVAWRYRRLQRRIETLRLIDEGPARIELERLAQRLDLQTTPQLYVTDEAASPMLVGVVQPKIILPEQLLARLTREELAMILAHELIHWRRRDTWVGWLQVFVQGVFWFHPLVWWANARIRHERECACDETVLREARCDRDGYGETILRALTAARGRSLAMGSMVGVFERGSRLQLRLEEIMSFDPTKRRFGWLSRAALVAAALALLPMAAPSVQAGGESDEQVADATEKTDDSEVNDKDKNEGQDKDKQKNKNKRPKTNWPVIVKTNPKIGATGVDAGLEEISVTFDRDMDVGGYSWTGGGEHFPQSPDGAGAVWIDKRTCVLPVRLERGKFYRVGINSTSFQNFRSELGVPTPTAAIFFTTEGAPKSLERQVRIPKVVKLTPKNGATDVDPGLKVIRVEFDMPMSTDGYSFTGGGPTFPTIPEGQRPRWSRDGKTCTLPVELKPDMQYELGLNSVSHKNFASRWGVALEPVVYKFHTSPGKE